ncbi:tyrosine-type recombinase/integrase [Streptomyces sp. OV198]|uniref:tyrosine-type recombinase/integrase n=1 Tax=Streptomyces sp. OV198 TaxID=1882787 RepID=UPI000BE3E97E|nr:tyrosine-type recombinase/integrase [Streptomyces sp. OV198]
MSERVNRRGHNTTVPLRAPRRRRFTPHDLRRACATHHYEQCRDLLKVHQLSGHRHIARTRDHRRSAVNG